MSELIDIKRNLSKPYWADEDGDEDSALLSFDDFCRELLPPGKNPDYPDGAVGVRVDDDFWVVAVLPWEAERFTIEEIVKCFWPSKVETAEYREDSRRKSYKEEKPPTP